MSTSLKSAAPVDNHAVRYFRTQVAIVKGNCSRRWKNVLSNPSKRNFRSPQHQQASIVQDNQSGGDAEQGFNLIRVRKLIIEKEEVIASSSNASNEGDYEEFPPKAVENNLFSTLPEVCDRVRGVEGYSDLPEVVEPVIWEAPAVACSPVVKKRDSAVRYFTSKWGGIRKLGASNKGRELTESKATLERYEEQLISEQVVAYEKRALLQDLTDPRGECWVFSSYCKH
jgi:hypothetical protein